MIWALSRVAIRLPPDFAEKDADILKKDGKHWFIAEVFGDDEHRPFSFTNWDWWRPSDWVTLLFYWKDLVNPVLEYPRDFTGEIPWSEITIPFESIEQLWEEDEDELP